MNEPNPDLKTEYEFAHGYRRCVDDGQAFMTIMSYPCGNGVYAPVINSFSNPTKLTSAGHVMGDYSTADCSWAMDQFYKQPLRDIRQSKAPFGLQATLLNTTAVVLTWQSAPDFTGTVYHVVSFELAT